MHTKTEYKNRYNALLTILLIVGGYLYLFTNQISIILRIENPSCIFKKITGMPCAGCGMTRATNNLMSGDILGSLSKNILCIPFTILILIALFFLLKDSIRNTNKFYSLIKQEMKPKYKYALYLFIGISWLINLIRL